MSKVYICQYFYTDDSEYEPYTEERIDKIVDSEEKAINWCIESAKKYCIETVKYYENYPDDSRDKAWEEDYENVMADLARIECVEREKGSLNEISRLDKGIRLSDEVDACGHYVWYYEEREVE